LSNNAVVPLFSAQIANQGLDLLAPIQRVLNRHWYVLGEEVRGFETEFAAYLGVPHCLGVANGSEALELGLRALGVGAGSRVVAIANAGFYSSTAIHAVGAQPVYVDIDAATMNMCPRALAAVIASRPAAIIVTHLYGQMAAIEELIAIAAQAGVPLIEDCAQSHGAALNGQRAGSFGDIGSFSFYPTKNLGALGDGGALVCKDDAIAARLKQLRQYGWASKYEVALPGGRNSRLDEMQAAILRTKLPHLDRWNAERRAIAARYNEAFAGLKDVMLPASVGEDYAGHLYVLRVPGRAAFMAALKAAGIATDIHYPIPDHRQPAYPLPAPVSLPLTEAASTAVVSLPCFPGLAETDVQRVIDAVLAYFQESRTC
jgi:dTDP-4-amino-4,6-dideoxygalactose transaminase